MLTVADLRNQIRFGVVMGCGYWREGTWEGRVCVCLFGVGGQCGIFARVGSHAQLEHVNIVKYLGTELNNITNELSIFLEYMPGGSIADLVSCII